MRGRAPIWIGLSACLAAGAAGPAHAADASATLAIDGEISARCALSLSEAHVSVALTEAAGARAIPFSVDCNQPMSVEMTSLNGGLAHATHRRGELYPGFANFIPYQAEFSVAVNGAVTVAASSEAMVAGAGGATGVVPHRANGSLRLSWQPSAALLGGDYADVIEIRVTGG